jgi:hypothetical protein
MISRTGRADARIMASKCGRILTAIQTTRSIFAMCWAPTCPEQS